MPIPQKFDVPKEGLAGLKEHWRNDLIASFSVALVALPLALGIAIASGVPPMSGVIAAIIGGLVTTFVRGSYIAINGPAAGLIVVVLSAMESLKDFRYVLAAIVCSGALQVIFGLLKLGKLGDVFPSSVIHGMLAAIGVIIFGKQIHVAMGTHPEAHNYLEVLLVIPQSVLQMNPFIAAISVISLLILVNHHKVKNKLIRFIPAPMWVMAMAIPLVFAFDLIHNHMAKFWDHNYHLGPEHLIQMPGSIWESLIFPDFAMIAEPSFWLAVISITLVASIETLLSTAAIDKIDPFKRKTDLNKDLVGVGLSTVISGLIGGLPIITVIVRSSVNINHGGKTRWANFFHGLILVGFVLFFTRFLGLIPLAALAAILVYTGFKLSSPKVFKDTYRKGFEQFLILIGTLGFTLKYGLLKGIFAGVILTLVIHLIKSRMPIIVFFKSLKKPIIQTFPEHKSQIHLKVSGLINFFNLLPLTKELDKLPREKSIDLDLSNTHLVDLTVMEYLDNYREKYRLEGGAFDIIGLDLHQSSSSHPHAMRVHIPPNEIYSLTRRQKDLRNLCETHQWLFEPQLRWGNSQDFDQFQFFQSRPIEYRNNIIQGVYKNLDLHWLSCDITCDEGALLATEVYRTTVQIIFLKQRLPIFTLEREEFFDKVLEITGYEELNAKTYTDFSKKFVLKGLDENDIRAFFTRKMITFFENHEIYHLESSGNALFVFKYLRLASPGNLLKMVNFSENLLQMLNSYTGGLPELSESEYLFHPDRGQVNET